MSALEKSLSRSLALRSGFQAEVLSLMSKGKSPFTAESLVPANAMLFDEYRNQTQGKKRYAQFRGYVHSAINALAQEGAGQAVQMGILTGGNPFQPRGKKDKSFLSKMPNSFQMKLAQQEMKLIKTDPMIDLLNRPNSVQYKYQFVYSFIANLCLTGFAFIVAGESKEGNPELYSLPTTWVKPSHKNGPFTEFKIVDPANPASEADATPLDRSQVAFAMLPDPSDPLKAMSPAVAQASSIAIDEKIQGSQIQFFDNGVFPSAVVTVGKNPHPEVAGGIRPRLSAAQRRQVYGAIKKISSGVANYGNPAIVDGLIEKIEKFSNTQPEIGWEKSEKTIRSRILSAFGVHPFILGEEMIGSYAQAYIIQERFAKKVNVFLDLLSCLCTDFVPGLFAEQKSKNTLLWFEKMSAVDPSMRQSLWTEARKNKDVSQNEFRAFMGLPPDEDSNESHIDKGMATVVMSVASQVSSGAIEVDQGVAILEGMGLPKDLAERIAGDGMSSNSTVQLIEQAISRISGPALQSTQNAT